jgi:DNA-binding Lrp family transcriptional regulator
MRPTSRPQSALRCPLNHLLGTEANVRVLRVVLLSDIPIGASEIARRAELQPSGVARVCTRLEDLGVIEAVGRGARNRQYRRAARFALKALVDLFREEERRALAVTQELKAAVQAHVPWAKSAWIEGPVAAGRDRPGDPVVVGILVDPATVDASRVELGQAMLAIESNHDVAIDVRVVTGADLETAGQERLADLEQARPLMGPLPLDLIGIPPQPGGKSRAPRRLHQSLDLRSRDIARLVADRIAKDPSKVEDAKRYLDRRIPSASAGERLELQEWQHILSTMSIPRLRRFLLQDDARAARLRQSSPFSHLLSQDERRALFTARRQRP